MWKALLLVLAASAAMPADVRLDRARELYARTDYESALRTLEPIENKDGEVFALIGKSQYMRGEFKRASEAFERAVAASPRNSEYHMWLGRAYGRRAETASFLTAPGLASKARESFESAVELDPRNLEAVSDLFEYYLEAPGIMGGGLNKAEALAQRLGEASPAEHHYMLAKIAEKRKQYRTAEEQFRLAAEAAPKQVGRVIDLAKFLFKSGRYDEAEAAFGRAQKIAPDSPKVLFERANAYIRAGKNLSEARLLLKRYLEAPLTPDDPPRRDAEQLLKQLPG